MDGLLIARVVFGLLLVVHGSQKLFGWFVELPFLYLTAALSLALIGPGAYSLDALLGLTSWWTPQVTAIVLATGVVGGLASLAVSRLGPAVAHA